MPLSTVVESRNTGGMSANRCRPAPTGVAARRVYRYPDRTTFIVMRFAKTSLHDRTVEIIKATFAKHDMIAVRVDEKEYHYGLSRT